MFKQSEKYRLIYTLFHIKFLKIYPFILFMEIYAYSKNIKLCIRNKPTSGE